MCATSKSRAALPPVLHQSLMEIVLQMANSLICPSFSKLRVGARSDAECSLISSVTVF